MEYEKAQRIIKEVGKEIIGKDDMIQKVLTCILAGGHILIEDVPGVGKTTLALAFSKAMSLGFKRVQFTPDVLAADITGFTVYNSETKAFEYREGAAVCSLLLADEINRTSSRTQSALLEVMEEGKVTVDGVTRAVPQPFIVIATQNPIGSVGTQMLPDSQLDRFMIKVNLGYPDRRDEINMLKKEAAEEAKSGAQTVVTRAELVELRAKSAAVFADEKILEYIVTLGAMTRANPFLQLGISPRGVIALLCMSKAAAFLKKRDYVIPEDVGEVFLDTAAHRVLLSPKARAENVSAAEVLAEMLKSQIGFKLAVGGE